MTVNKVVNEDAPPPQKPTTKQQSTFQTKHTRLIILQSIVKNMGHWPDLIAVSMNFLGAILGSVSFQAVPSDFRLVTASGYDIRGVPVQGATSYAICVHDNAMAITDDKGSVGLGVHSGCPDHEHAEPVAVVTSNRPFAAKFGFILSAFGFGIEVIAIALRMMARKPDPSF